MEAKKEGKTGARNRSRPDRRKEQVPARHPEPCTPPLTAPIAFTWRLCEAHSFLCGAVGNLRAVALFSLYFAPVRGALGSVWCGGESESCCSVLSYVHQSAGTPLYIRGAA